MKPKSQRILLVTSVALPLLLAIGIAAFPATAWDAWAEVHYILGNEEQAHEATRKALRVEMERDFKRKHAEDGVWIRVPKSHFRVAAQRYFKLSKEKTLSSVLLADRSSEIYVFKHMQDSFTLESLDEYEQSLNRN